jgi:hypothetical protein
MLKYSCPKTQNYHVTNGLIQRPIIKTSTVMCFSVGLLTGPINTLHVVDMDVKVAGVAGEYGNVNTVTVQTPWLSLLP